MPSEIWLLSGEQETCSQFSIKINEEKPETDKVLLAQRKGMTSSIFFSVIPLHPEFYDSISHHFPRVNTPYRVKIKLSVENKIMTVS